MQNYKKILDKYKKISFIKKNDSALFARLLFNKILRTDSVEEKTALLLVGYDMQLPLYFQFDNKIEFINNNWFFNSKPETELTPDEKDQLTIEKILLKIKL